MRSLGAALVALGLLAAAPLRAQPEVDGGPATEAPTAETVSGRGSEPSAAGTDATGLDPTSQPPALQTEHPRPTGPPIVPPGGVPEVGGPSPGEREREPDPTPSRPPLPPTHYAVELQVRASFPEESSFHRALSDLRYRGVRVVPTGYVGVQIPLVEWFWVGGRLGMRGMTWAHFDLEDASAIMADALVTAQVRVALGRVLEIGALVGGGAGVVDVQVGGVDAAQVVGRFVAEGFVAFRLGDNASVGPRFGWGYAQWEGMNAYDHGLDLGGPFFGLALEGRE